MFSFEVILQYLFCSHDFQLWTIKSSVGVKTDHFCLFICCRSPYCMREFDVALHHNITLKRKWRLIVLMMMSSASLNADTDPVKDSLRHYVRQYTYIDYNAADWLNKLLYALPLHGMAGQLDEDDANLLLA